MTFHFMCTKPYEEHKVSLTVSVGVAVTAHRVDPAAFSALADQKLYEAKDKGRNRVCF